MITLANYYMGRDRSYPQLLSTDLRNNAARTVEAANLLLAAAEADGVKFKPNLATAMVRSGWRPPAVNGNTPGASKTSLHMQCLAVDLEDVGGRLGAWCLLRADTVLRDLALWLEHPGSTPSWCHVQLKPPGSGNRVFRP